MSYVLTRVGSRFGDVACIPVEDLGDASKMRWWSQPSFHSGGKRLDTLASNGWRIYLDERDRIIELGLKRLIQNHIARFYFTAPFKPFGIPQRISRKLIELCIAPMTLRSWLSSVHYLGRRPVRWNRSWN